MTNQEQALQEIVARLERAWNEKDSALWAGAFAEDVDFIHILGGHYIGRDNVEHAHRAIFDTIYNGSTLTMKVEKMRFPAPDVAIVFLLANLKMTQPGFPPAMEARPTMILQKRGDGWEIVTFQNTRITPEGAPSAGDPIVDQHPFRGGAKIIED